MGPPKAGGGNEGVQEARVRESTISGNSAVHGGGIYVFISASGAATLSDNRILENRASYGSGIYLRVSSSGTATLSDNRILRNHARDGGGGIGIVIRSSSMATLSSNKILGNRSDGEGDGIVVSFTDSSARSTVAIRENLILYKTAPSEGGGIHAEIQSIYQPTFTLNRNDIAGNAPMQLWNKGYADSSNLDARNNWWGTTDEAEIQEGIWDWNDDLSLGVVDWRPYLTAPVFPNHPPYPPASPSPADGTSGVARNFILIWSASADLEPRNTMSYDVHLGTEVDPPLVSKGQGFTSYTPPALLKRNTIYYWRVVARDSQGGRPLALFGVSPPGPDRGPI